MVAVYSSALIFDPWNKITECEAFPALLDLPRGGEAGGSPRRGQHGFPRDLAPSRLSDTKPGSA